MNAETRPGALEIVPALRPGADSQTEQDYASFMAALKAKTIGTEPRS